MNLTNIGLTERVAAGVRLLDEKGPADWRDRIDLETLDVGSCTECVLGQVYGHGIPADNRWGLYTEGLRQLGLYSFGDELIAIAHGFDTALCSYDPHGVGPAELTDEWKRQLALVAA